MWRSVSRNCAAIFAERTHIRAIRLTAWMKLIRCSQIVRKSFANFMMHAMLTVHNLFVETARQVIIKLNEPYRRLRQSSELFRHFRNVQQDSEDFSNIQNASQRAGGIGRGKKYPGAEIPDHDYDRDDYIIMEEAYAEFEAQGERRSVRMIAEYCKTGELVCTYDSDDKRWHITRESVEHKIAKIKALNARKAAAAPQHTSEPFNERPAAPQRPTEEAPPQSESDSSPFALIKKLRKRILNLRILNQGKDYVIEQLNQEREQLLTRIETSSRRVGELEIRLLQLEAPKRPATAPPTPLDPVATYHDVEDVSSSHTIHPTPNMSPYEPLPDNVNTYEHSPQQQ